MYALLLANNLLGNRVLGGAEWIRIYPQDVLLLVLISLCVLAARSKRKVIYWSVLILHLVLRRWCHVCVSRPAIHRPAVMAKPRN